jgi:hypothetical protein
MGDLRPVPVDNSIARINWKWLQNRLAQGIWLGLALISVAIFVTGGLSLYRNLQQPCTLHPADCTQQRLLTTDNLSRLETMGLSLTSYALFVLVSFSLLTAFCLFFGWLIFIRRPKDGNAWFVALFLVLYGSAGNTAITTAAAGACHSWGCLYNSLPIWRVYCSSFSSLSFPTAALRPDGPFYRSSSGELPLSQPIL